MVGHSSMAYEMKGIFYSFKSKKYAKSFWHPESMDGKEFKFKI